MRIGLEIVQQTEYVTHFYDSKEEALHYECQMAIKGWIKGASLSRLEKDEICYSKTTDIKRTDSLELRL